MANFCNPQTSLVAVLCLILLTLFTIYQSPAPLTFTKSTISSSTISLSLKISQISKSPPTLLITLKNSNTNTSYTILTWDTPLDIFALDTGVFSIIGDISGSEVEQEILHINRKMPPSQSALLTLAPGAEEITEIIFDKSWMPKEKPASYKVKAAGKFAGGWDRYGHELTQSDLMKYSESPLSRKRWATNEIVMVVE